MCKVHRSSDMWEYMLLVASSLWHALNGCLWVVVVVSPKNEKTVNLLHLVISTRRRSGNREGLGPEPEVILLESTALHHRQSQQDSKTVQCPGRCGVSILTSTIPLKFPVSSLSTMSSTNAMGGQQTAHVSLCYYAIYFVKRHVR